MITIKKRVYQYNQMNSSDQSSQSQATIHREDRSNNVYKDWICSRIREGSIKCYSLNDIEMRLLPIGRGAFGAVHVGIMKNSGKRVALKTLYLKQYSCEEELYKDFV